MKCINCSKEFKNERSTARFCSTKCRLAYRRKSLSVSENGLSVSENVTLSDPKPVKTAIDTAIEPAVSAEEPEEIPYEELSPLQQALRGDRPGHKPLTMCSKHNCWAETCGCK